MALSYPDGCDGVTEIRPILRPVAELRLLANELLDPAAQQVSVGLELLFGEATRESGVDAGEPFI